MSHLTQRQIDSLREPGYLWDDAPKGLAFRRYPSGEQSFVFRFRLHGRQLWMKVGRYPETTLDAARRLSLGYAADAASGVDPRVPKNSEVTVRDLGERYLAEHARPHKKAKSVKEDERLLNTVIYPMLGHLTVMNLTHGDVQKLHTKHRSSPYVANRALNLLSTMLNMAEVWSIRQPKTNPTMFVKRYKEKARKRMLTQEEIGKLADVLSGWPHAVSAGIVRLLIFTGCRKGEIVGLKWEYLDEDLRTIELPDSKTGAKTVHVNEAARKILTEVQVATGMGGEGFVFPNKRGTGPYGGLQGQWEKMVKAAGLEDVRVHDLRHHYGNVAAGAGLALPVIGALLGHRRAATTERYATVHADPQKMAAERIGQELTRRMG